MAPLARQVYRREGSPCQEDDDSLRAERLRCSRPNLPEEIWHHTHSLMPLQEAARVACVSRTFLRSWRCHPNIILTRQNLGLKYNSSFLSKGFKDKNYVRKFIRRVDNILKNHSGTNVKIFELAHISHDNSVSFRRLNSWLKAAVSPGIEEITFCSPNREYNFPCSLLSNGVRNSIRHFYIFWCAFHPTVELGSFRSLVKLDLSCVGITDDDLGCLLSNSLALEELVITACPEIICLQIPRLLQRLSKLIVFYCDKMEVMESNAPNISLFQFSAEYPVELSLGESLKLKDIRLYGGSLICCARSKFPSSVPNLESLSITSLREVVCTPMLPTKFLYLKQLSITDGYELSRDYDYFSLVSLLGASPSLETFTLKLLSSMVHTSILEDSSNLRLMTEHRYEKLKTVNIIGFSSLKSLVELTCHIIENTVSLECLTLDTTNGYGKVTCFGTNSIRCGEMRKEVLIEAPRALLAINKYIEGIVPSTVKLCVIQPCRRCDVDMLFAMSNSSLGSP